jgi:HK97 family phage major capsid protein
VSLDPLGSAALERATDHARRMMASLNLVQPSPADRRRYSLARALLFALEGKDAGVESMVSDEYERAGFKRRMQNSILVPSWAILRNLERTGMRALLQPYQTTLAGSGAELVETTLLGDEFIDALRPRSVVLQLGAQSINGLVGDIQIPRADTTSSAFWLTTAGSFPTLSGAITESEGTFDATPLTAAPCQVGAVSKVSRLLLQQTKSNLAETIISNDLTKTLATALDFAAIQGPGTGGSPTGVVNTTGVNAVAGATLANAGLIGAVEDVANANAIINRRSLGWAANPSVAALLMNRVALAATWSPLWAGALDTGVMGGYPALASTNVPAGDAIFGDWSQILVLSWGDGAPIEVEVNPFQNFATGDVGIRAMLSANVVVRHAASFSLVSGIT